MYNKSLHTQFSTPDMVRSPFCSTVRSLSGYMFSLWTPGRLRHCAAVHGDLWWRFGAIHTGDGVLPKHPGRIFEIHWSTGILQTSGFLHVFTSSMPSLGWLVDFFVHKSWPLHLPTWIHLAQAIFFNGCTARRCKIWPRDWHTSRRHKRSIGLDKSF